MSALAGATIATNASYNRSQADIAVWLSEYAYCSVNYYTQVNWAGPATGFQFKSNIYDSATDTQGFIGYLPSDNGIYVSFRGSSSIPNWLTNLSTTKTKYTSFADCNCNVHAGFYNAE